MKLFDILFFGLSAALIAVAYFLIFKKSNKKEKKKDEGGVGAGQAAAAAPADEPQEEQAGVRNRNARAVRNRGNREEFDFNANNNRRAAQPADDDDEEEKDGDDDDAGKTEKQVMKETKRKEKEEQRKALLAHFEEKEKKEAGKRAKYEERERLREEEERKKEELQKQLEEEQRKKEEEEYNKWKHLFSVDEAGTEKVSEAEEQNLMQKFIDYIKLRKVVMLDDVATAFKLSTKDVVDRITSLEATKVLNGVLDDRGKYIYITENEMHGIINYIKQKGRVNRTDLVSECNKIIKLNLTEQERQRIMQEESKFLEEVESEFSSLQKEAPTQ